jgi:hypothetical protein
VLTERRAPLPAPALVAVRPLHRGFAAGCVRIVLASGLISAQMGVLGPGDPVGALLWAAYDVAPAVTFVTFTEEALLGRGWARVASLLFAVSGLFYTVVLRLAWVGTPPATIDMVSTMADVFLLLTPLLVLLYTRLIGSSVVTSAIAMAVFSPLLAIGAWTLLRAAHGGAHRWSSSLLIAADLIVALPIAVRMADLIGPWRAGEGPSTGQE